MDVRGIVVLFMGGARELSLEEHLDLLRVPPSLLFIAYWGPCLYWYRSQAVQLITDSHLVPRLRMNGAVLPLLLIP